MMDIDAVKRDRLSDDEEVVAAVMAGMDRKHARDYDKTAGAVLRGHYKAGSMADFDRKQALAMLDDLIVVQVSERKFQLGRRRFMGGTQRCVPYVELEPTRYTMFDAFDEYQRRMEKPR